MVHLDNFFMYGYLFTLKVQDISYAPLLTARFINSPLHVN
jgi:hypothetical protein